MATKDAVLDYLKHDRSMLTGRNLYNKFPNKSLAVQNYLSRLSNSEKNLKVLCYELCVVAGIPERQMTILLSKPVVKKQTTKVITIPTTPTKTPTLEEQLIAFTGEETEETIQALATFVGVKETEDVIAAIEKAKEILVTNKLENLDINTKESIKLRQQFPFLKNEDCPRELKLLVADLITAYEEFITKQPQLHNNATQEQLQQLVADVNGSYINRKEIFAELENYKNTGKLLGKHPLFKQLEEEETILKLDSTALSKKINNLTNYINRNTKKLNEATTDEDKAKYKAKVDNYTRLKEFAVKEQEKRK